MLRDACCREVTRDLLRRCVRSRRDHRDRAIDTARRRVGAPSRDGEARFARPRWIGSVRIRGATRRAGAEVVLLTGTSGAVVFLAEPPEAALATSPHHTVGDGAVIEHLGRLIEIHFVGTDVVLAEGFAPVHELLVTVHRVRGSSRRYRPGRAERGWPSRMPEQRQRVRIRRARHGGSSNRRRGSEANLRRVTHMGPTALANPRRIFDCRT